MFCKMNFILYNLVSWLLMCHLFGLLSNIKEQQIVEGSCGPPPLQKIWRQHCLVITFQHNTDTFAIRYFVLESTDPNS